jgi:SET domain-containing protein
MPTVPRVGFFALRDIQAGEELSIDYSPNHKKSDSQLKKVVKCYCGVKKCKGWLF